MKKLKLYLDLDGCFADFFTKSKELCGFAYHENPVAFWGVVETIDHFFLQLEPLEGAIDLFRAVEHNNPTVLTALPMLSKKLLTAPADKRLWVKKHMSPTIHTICVTRWDMKKQYASPDAVLVDDSERNIKDWISAGGIGIHHTSNGKTLLELSKLGLVNELLRL